MAEQLDCAPIDLHIHTHHSDGALSVGAVLERAKAYELGAISITDHDTVAAYHDEEYLAWRETRRRPQVIPGVEISTTDSQGNKHHVLGLHIDPESIVLRTLFDKIRGNRITYTTAVCERLQQGGWEVNTSRLLTQAATVTKAHIARALLAEAGNSRLWKQYTDTTRPTEGQLIEATLTAGRPFYVDQQTAVTSEQAIDAIHRAAGVAVLAHPAFSIMNGAHLERLCLQFLEWGIDGLEGIYIQHDRSNHDKAVEYREALGEFCARHGLILTGGSDFHTDNVQQIGSYIDIGFRNHPWKVPYHVVEQIEERAQRYRT